MLTGKIEQKTNKAKYKLNLKKNKTILLIDIFKIC